MLKHVLRPAFFRISVITAARQLVAIANLPPTSALAAQSKKRGLSLEEKREKVLEIFHESKDVFQLKVGPQLYLQ